MESENKGIKTMHAIIKLHHLNHMNRNNNYETLPQPPPPSPYLLAHVSEQTEEIREKQIYKGFLNCGFHFENWFLRRIVSMQE